MDEEKFFIKFWIKYMATNKRILTKKITILDKRITVVKETERDTYISNLEKIIS